MLRHSVERFPELSGRTIVVGYSRANLGSAVLEHHRGSDPKLTIRLKVRELSYNTIGHELTHLVQGLAKIRLSNGDGADGLRIPDGEKQCDIWTLARSSLFCDDAPIYLRLPRIVREKWPRYAESVRRLCIAAIEKRKTYRFYLRWLESRLKELPRSSVSRRPEGQQMSLPFGSR